MKLKKGDRFGRLTVLRIFYTKRISKTGKTYYQPHIECKCDCGQQCVKNSPNLTRATSTLSCGCTDGRGKKTWVSGRKQLALNHSKYFPQQYHTYLRKQAAKGNHEFALTPQDIDRLYEKQKGLCYYSGVPLVIPPKDQSFTDYIKGRFNRYAICNDISLDRIDNTKGYVKGNVVFCTSTINLCKQGLSQQDFLHICRLVTENT